ncbi:MAG TPA: MMPL family transporter [Gaiellaceae bacterium]|nr:MMPL family transporter [Gaiellaceae bacterium]
MTARLTRFGARRPWPVVGAWVVLLVASAAALVLVLPGSLTTEADVAVETEASRGFELLERHFPQTQEDLELVIVRARELRVSDPEYARELSRLTRALDALDGVSVPPAQGDPVVSDDGRATVLPFALAEGASVDVAEPPVVRLDADPRFDAALYGAAVIDRDFNAASQHDLKRGETFGVAAALVILVLVFGAFVGALVPLLLAAVAIGVTLGLVALLAEGVDLSIFVVNVVAGMGLALGIDYTLFVVSRVREERARGLSTSDALAAAGETASRAVLFSGIAVAVALTGIVFVPDTVLRSLGIGAVLVAVVSVLAALTLLPAVLALLGDRVNALRVPVLGRAAVSGEAEGRFWAWLAERVMRRPLLAALLSGGVLLAAAAPVVGLASSRLGVETLPQRYEARQGYDLLVDAFGYGRLYPTRVVVEGDAQAAARALEELGRRLEEERGYAAQPVAVSRDGRAAMLEVAVPGDPLGDEAFAAVRELRRRYVPAAGLPEGSRAHVTGVSAANLDYVRVTTDARPRSFAFVFAMSFLLLMLAFRSLVVPAKAILLNLLSVGAAYGLLVLVFQHGVGAGLLGFRQVDAIEVWVPVFLFAILFGLSMDYHVFLLSRIRERYGETRDNAASVAHGIATTGRVITGAALIIIVVFTGFALGDLVMLQQMGFGVAVALLLDATVIRVVLVPATMRLLGERNWYLPRWLEWLPRVHIESPRLTAAGGERRLTATATRRPAARPEREVSRDEP